MKFDKLHKLIEGVFEPISDTDKLTRQQEFTKIDLMEMVPPMQRELVDILFSHDYVRIQKLDFAYILKFLWKAITNYKDKQDKEKITDTILTALYGKYKNVDNNTTRDKPDVLYIINTIYDYLDKE